MKLKLHEPKLTRTLLDRFQMKPYRPLNDAAFDLINDQQQITQLSWLFYNAPEEYEELRDFVASYKPGRMTEQYALLRAYCHYVDREFEPAFDLGCRVVENNPACIDAWIDLCFFMAHIPDLYDVYLNLRFHLYYFIHAWHRFDFRTLDRRALRILDGIVRSKAREPEVRDHYMDPVVFSTEYLYVNGACNNNCTVCPVPPHLKDYDFDERVGAAGLMPTAKYIYVKLRKKTIKHFHIKGGEPTLHPAYFKILKTAASMRPDIETTVHTNARVFCSSAFREKSRKAAYDNLVYSVSLFSSDPAVHDAVTRTQGSHAQTLQGIDAILSDGGAATVDVRVCDETIASLADTLEMVRDKFSSAAGFKGISVSLPAPSAQNLERYSTERIQSLYAAASSVLEGRPGGITVSNAALALIAGPDAPRQCL